MNVLPEIKPVRGFKVAGVHSGLKKEGKLDFALVLSDRNCAAAGIFTTNQVKAAPVLLDIERLKQNSTTVRAVAVNTGCANACTGSQGLANAQRTSEIVAELAGLSADQVLVLSTGVIGTQLPMEKIAAGVELAYGALNSDWQGAASAITTTDRHPKMAAISVRTPNGEYTIAGMGKGAGMIAPNMATMLSVIVTDAVLTPSQAQDLLRAAASVSFNRIVVDGDTSTNDTVLLLANGASGVSLDAAYETGQFQAALDAVSIKLAQDIVRDGEGATKFITIAVTGAADNASAHKIANTIATSSLVKTAFFGGDANWGRIIAAAGRSGQDFDPDRAQLWIAPGEELFEDDKGLLLFSGGMPVRYSEAAATEIFQEESIYVSLDCGNGSGSAVVWTCDLSHDYVSINGDYRT